MSVADLIRTHKYIVTVYDHMDLNSVYDELENKGKSPPGCSFTRQVECIDRRPNSRSTIYRLTEWEADELKNDSRIRSIEIDPSELGIQAGTNSIFEQTSSNWDKSTSTTTNMKNWGLLRCYEDQQRSNWGGTGFEGTGSGVPAQTGTIRLTQTGKNVDVVVVDGNGLVFGHPDYAVNSDGTGGSRAIQYNWYQHQTAVGGSGGSNYSYSSTSDHATHVAGTVAGNTQGWARSSNIYNIFYYAGANGNTNFPFVMDYVREFHKTKSINPQTGRKNPTITNNSWGMSIFPNEWSLSDITAVTYRGVRYTPAGGVTYTGFSGVCTSNERLSELAGLENHGNRIVTTGIYAVPGGTILTFPPSWEQTGQQVTLNQFTEPDAVYEVTIQGPTTLELINNVAVNAISGFMSLSGEIEISEGVNVVTTFTDGPYISENGGSLEYDIRETISLPNNSTYTIKFKSTVNVENNTSLLIAVAMSLTATSDSGGLSATVTTIDNVLLGAGSLTASTSPTAGNNDDGFWTLTLPFNISYLGNSYSTVYVGTNSYITFGGGSTAYSNLSATTPNLPKIMWGATDNSVQRIYFGTEGSAPNRTYRVRIEGNAGLSGTLGSPNMVSEYVFYENTPNRIDLQLGQTNRKTTGSGFTTQQLNQWGFIASQRIPVRVNALDSDIENAIDEGILFVGAAGNGRWKHDVPGGPDWNNTFEMANRYPASVNQPYYYMRGSSPTANDTTENGGYDIPNICVGSVDSIQIDQKVLYSDCGPGVDIWAPGTHIVSALPSGTNDPRNSSFKIGKFSGTSMASPQVCGILACALEIYPNMTQEEAKSYIIHYAKSNQLITTSGGPTDGQDLQGAPNLFLYYYKERQTDGNTFPKINYKPRPSTGAVFPRPRIKRTG